MQRAMMFIDGPNLFFSSKDNKWTVDLAKLRSVLPSLLELELVEARYHDVTYIPIPNKKWLPANYHLVDILDKADYELVVGGFLGDKEKGIDVSVAVDLIEFGLKDKYDEAILIAGDGDYVPAIHALQTRHSKKVNVSFFKGATNLSLIEFADRYIPFEEIRDEIES